MELYREHRKHSMGFPFGLAWTELSNGAAFTCWVENCTSELLLTLCAVVFIVCFCFLDWIEHLLANGKETRDMEVMEILKFDQFDVTARTKKP